MKVDRLRKSYLFLFLLLFVSGCSGGGNAEQSLNVAEDHHRFDNRAYTGFHSEIEHMALEPTVTINDKTLEVVHGNLLAEQLLEEVKPIQVRPKEEVTIRLPFEPTDNRLTILEYKAGDEGIIRKITLDEVNHFTLPEREGTYVYMIQSRNYPVSLVQQYSFSVTL